MAYNDRKIIKVLAEELQQLEERYPGYKNDMQHVLPEILNLEREHALSRINVVQKIGDQVNTVGMDLYRAKHSDGNANGDSE